MALLSTQTIAPGGTTPAFAACTAGGDTFTPATTAFLMLQNTSASPATVTVDVTAESYGQPVQNVTITVPAGATILAGPYPPGEVANAAGVAAITYSAVTGLSVAVLNV